MQNDFDIRWRAGRVKKGNAFDILTSFIVPKNIVREN